MKTDLEKQIQKISFSQQQVLKSFIDSGKEVLSLKEISDYIQKKDRSLGGIIGSFFKIKKKWTKAKKYTKQVLLEQVSKGRYILNPKIKKEIKEIIEKIK